MNRFFQKSIFFSFCLLFLLVPLVLFPETSEIFEFNKITLVYFFTVLITVSWLVRSILVKKFIFRRTILDTPLFILLTSQVLSTIFSIDIRTSLLGYYGRFHGGFLSTVSYCLLYWAYVTNINFKKTLTIIRITLLSGLLVAIYGILQHLGVDKDIWVQDVQNRVFSTLGQPNWLAAWLATITPLAWAAAISKSPALLCPSSLACRQTGRRATGRKFPSSKDQTLLISKQISRPKFKNLKNYLGQLEIRLIFYLLLSVFFFTTLLFTRSRSGLLGFVAAELVFWGFVLIKFEKQFLKEFLIFNISFFILTAAIGNPFAASNLKPQASNAPALEISGTESGEIRKIVWKGAIDIWRNYPLLGSGVETFAYSYYKFRPAEHNLVSEWEFLYNKAHNEYLNFAANTGSVGLLSYSVVIIFSLIQILENSKTRKLQTSKQAEKPDLKNFNLLGVLDVWKFGIFAGYVSILITNFFGFSVTPVALLFFLYPAVALSLEQESKRVKEYNILPALRTRGFIPEGRMSSLPQFIRNLRIGGFCKVANKSTKLSNVQIIAFSISCSLALLLLCSIFKYWRADFYYAKGKFLNNTGDYPAAEGNLTRAITLTSKEPLYHSELADVQGRMALSLNKVEDSKIQEELILRSIKNADIAINLSPFNPNFRRNKASLLIKLSIIDPKLLENAAATLGEAILLAPTDAKLHYNLGLTLARIGNFEKSIQVLERTIDLKANYRDARLALALILSEKGEKQEAVQELKYILEEINPEDELAKEKLQELGK